jgi:hypothetical protein
MSNFPSSLDNDTTLPPVNNNVTEIGGEAINSLRDAVFNIEQYIIGSSGYLPSLSAFLGVSFLPTGAINPSVLTSLGLVTLPITDEQIGVSAAIQESKLALTYPTQTLYNYIQDLSRSTNTALGWISTTGVELPPHLMGIIYRHSMDQIDVSHNLTNFPFLDNNLRMLRNNTNSYTLVNDINNELLAHQWADGSNFGTISNIITNDGNSYPSNFAHIASGIYLQSSVFSVVPQTANNLQLFAEYVDESSLLLLGSRIQNLYANGISRNSVSSALPQDGYGQAIIPFTPATAFLRYGNSSSPVDNINNGDDIVQFNPTTGNAFIAQFAAVQVGDILRINYGTVEVQFIILEKKYISTSNTFIVRIDGKNLFNTSTAMASVNRSLNNNNKYGVLAMAPVITTGIGVGIEPSLIIGAPRGAQCLGSNFDAGLFDTTHYLLYLALYPDGSPQDGYLILPAIDVTGNQGNTAGQYTLESIVAATNAAFRASGYNYRFIAFQYQGQFGIMLADSYNNASFSILSVVVDTSGNPAATATAVAFPNNVIGFPNTNNNGLSQDPLGLGPQGANVASPPYQSSYISSGQALQPTKLFVPLKRNNYYVDGVEKEQLSLDVGQFTDGYGDGYWPAIVTNITTIGSRVQVTYSVSLDLSTSQLKNGKTLVVQSLGHGGSFPNDFGRYIISNVSFSTTCVNNVTTTTTAITVYDAVHGIGVNDGYVTINVGNEVALYFDSSSVSFDAETATDFNVVTPFKRHFEVYIDSNANTFTHERGRIYLGTSPAFLSNLNTPPGGTYLLGNSNFAANLNLVSISPKLQGYQFGNVTKITLNVLSFSLSSGIYDGYLCSWNNSGPMTNIGPTITAKQGQTTRFYDETNIDYLDINLDFTTTLFSFTNQPIDIQLFPTLALDEQVMILGSCQVNDTSQVVNYLQDLRQFGNVSEEQLTTSALEYIAAPTRALQENGIIRGLDFVSGPTPVFTAIASATFNVVQTSSTVQVSVSQLGTLNVGSIVSFASQPGTNYTISAISVSGLTLTLSTTYTGTTNSATTATYASIFPNSMIFNGGEAVINGNLVQANNQSVTIPIIQELISPFSAKIPNGLIVWFVCINEEGEFTLIASTDFAPDSNLAATYIADSAPALAEDRLFYVISPNSAAISPYPIRATYFNDLVQNQKDVVPVGIVTAIVSAPGTVYSLTSFTFHDARRFVYNGYGGLAQPLVLGEEASFQSLDAVTTWLDQLTNYQSAVDYNTNIGWKVIVKDNFILSGSPTNLDYNFPVLFEGDGGIFNIQSACGFTVGNNVTFNNIRFNYTFNPVGDGVYLTTQLANPANAAIYCNVDPINGNINLSFKNCLFTSSNQYRYGFIGFNFSASTCYAQNITISNNRFETSYAADDQLAVVTFAGPAVDPTTTTGARLNNCIIEGNFCNKNQMLMIAPTLTGSNILDLIAASNTRIVGNTCGAINVMIKQDYPLSIPNTVFELDKAAEVIISQNTCKFIYSGFANGNVASSGGNQAITYVQDGYGLLVGNLVITENNTSFVQVGYRITSSITSGAPVIVVRNNKFTAYNPAYLTPYYNNVAQTSPPLAVIVWKVVGT